MTFFIEALKSRCHNQILHHLEEIRQEKNKRHRNMYLKDFKRKTFLRVKNNSFEQNSTEINKTQNLVFLIILNLHFRKSDNFLKNNFAIKLETPPGPLDPPPQPKIGGGL